VAQGVIFVSKIH